jgi:hypothetical protein
VSLAPVVPSAQAAPTPSPTCSPAPTASAAPDVQAKATRTKQIDTTLSTSQSEKVLRASLVMDHSDSGHLDWAPAKKYFGDHTTWCDDFAAGAVGAGATLDDAADSTRTRPRQRWNDMGVDPARTPLAKRGGTNCTGVTKDVKYTKDRGRSESWYDSCDTNTMIGHYKSCTGIMAFAGIAAANYWTLIPGAIAMVCYLNQNDVEVAQKNSNVSAVKWYYTLVGRVGGSGAIDGAIRITADVYSQ